MKRYIRCGGLISNALNNLMRRAQSALNDAVKEAFTSSPPKDTSVKDPDTGAIGTLYTYKCASDNLFQVEMYAFPGVQGSFLVKCYIADNSETVMKDTIKILNTRTDGGFKPIKQNQLMKKISEYADDNFELLGSFEDVDKAQYDTDRINDDGYEPADSLDDDGYEE